MPEKTYRLTINRSNGTSEQVLFVIPAIAGTYKLKFTLSNGQTIDAGNVTVDENENVYNLDFSLSNGSWLNAGQIKTPIIPPTLQNATWSFIAQASAAGLASEYWSVGDEKTIYLTTGEEVTLVILGFDHDTLYSGGGLAGITFGTKELIVDTYAMNTSDTNAGGWYSSAMRQTKMQDLLQKLPSDLRSVIKRVIKRTTSGSSSTTISNSPDYLFLFSEVEIDGTTENGYAGEGTRYAYWIGVKDGTSNAGRRKRLENGAGDYADWWLRSPNLDYGDSFQYIRANGYVRENYANTAKGICFGFCV